MSVTSDRAVTYNQAKEMLMYMAGIHAALTKDIPQDDYAFMYSTVINGGGPAKYPVGTIIVTEKDNYRYPWAVMHHGEHEDGRPYMILRVIKAIDQIQFDAPEAFYYAEEGLAAGTYHFNVPTAYQACPAGDYQFTLASAVPAGGRLAFNFNPYSYSPVDGGVTVYDSANSMVISQTATISSGDGGTLLGLLKHEGDPDVANMNSLTRVCFGNGNYAQSAIRQYFISSAAAGSVWKSSNKFDQAPGWNASTPGFLTKLPEEFIDIVNPVTISTVTNNVFEVDYTKGSSYAVTDKFWLPSRYNVFGTTEGADLHEEQWDYYKGATDVDRIMFDNSGTARHQFLRTPFVGDTCDVRFVGASGALVNYIASGGHAESPACEISAPKKPAA